MPFLRLQEGPIELLSIQAQPDEMIPATSLFPAVKLEELESEFKRVPEYFGTSYKDLKFTQNIFLVRAFGRTILIDTGIPNDHQDAILLEGLLEAEIDLAEIDIVFLTHRDLDHVGGTVKEGMPTFPNAKYMMGKSEWMSYRSDSVRNHFPTYIQPLIDKDQFEVVDDTANISPGISLVPTPGHREGTTSVLVNDRILITADTWHCASQVTFPDWEIMFDTNSHEAAQSRKTILRRAVENKYIVCVPHTPYFGVGYISGESGNYAWQSRV